MITDELARNRDAWIERAQDLHALARECRQIPGWDSPSGELLKDSVGHCALSIATLAEKAEKLAEAYELHLQVVSVGGRIQI